MLGFGQISLVVMQQKSISSPFHVSVLSAVLGCQKLGVSSVMNHFYCLVFN